MRIILTHSRLLILMGMLLSLAGLTSCKKKDGFTIADTNSDGIVDQAEFTRFMNEAIYTEMDADGNSRVTFEETTLAYPEANKERFKKADFDGDGVVTPKEAKSHFDKQGTFQDLFTKIDSDKSQGITREESRAFLRKMEKKAGTTLQQLKQAADES